MGSPGPGLYVFGTSAGAPARRGLCACDEQVVFLSCIDSRVSRPELAALHDLHEDEKLVARLVGAHLAERERERKHGNSA